MCLQGVEGGRWFRLIDKVYDRRNLHAAFSKVARNKGAAGVDHVTIEMVDDDEHGNILRLHELLKDEAYRPREVRDKYS